MARKECGNCGLSVGVRTKECPDCGYKFLIRKRGPRPKEIDWAELKPGDTIKVVTGTGPYFLSKDRPGEKLMMGHKGVFEVIELYGLDKPKGCGVVGRQITNRSRSSYREHIYMGESWYNDDLSLHEEPHKILGIKTEATVIEKKQKKKSANRISKSNKIDTNSLNKLIEQLDE